MGEGWDGGSQTAGVAPSPCGGRLGWGHPNGRRNPFPPVGEGRGGGIQTARATPSPVGEGWDGGIQTSGVAPSPRGGRLGWGHPNCRESPPKNAQPHPQIQLPFEIFLQ